VIERADFRAAVNPLRCAVRAARKPRATFPGHPFDACVSPMEAAGKTFFPLAILLRAESPVVCHRGKPRATHALRPVFHAPKPCLPITPTRALGTRLLFSIRVRAWAMNSCFDSFTLAVLVPLPGSVPHTLPPRVRRTAASERRIDD
jgi:hypothetical protein